MNNDLISRSALMDDIQADVDYGGVGGMVGGALKRYVKRAPAVYAVIPVRCKDCKHYHDFETHFDCNHICGMDYVQPNDFCSYGERRTEE